MKVPKLRFKEFSDDWQTSELDKIATTSSGGTPNRAKPEYWGGGSIPWITTSLIDFNVINNSDEFITEEGLKNSSAKLFPKDTLLMAMYGQGKTRGKVAILGLEASTNQACAAITFHQNTISVQFVFQNLAGRYDEIRDLSNVGGQENLSAGLIKQIQITFPGLPEQTKIANFLTAIDEKITQLTQKCDLLAQYKKGVMQQIFSQKLRFKDDDGREFPEWEVQEIGNYLVKHEEKSTKNNQFPVLTSSRKGLFFQKNYFNGYDVASKDNTGYNVVPRNYFTYRHMSDDLIFAFNRNNIVDKGIVSTLYPVFTTRNIDDNFLELILNYGNEFKEFAIQQKQGGSRTYMYFSKLEKLELNLPCEEEQTKIANFLTAIDDKIIQAQAQLDAVKLYKKGLLQQMFV
ncbi:restriction endonuclease subunit S [Nitrosomonas oligotropha]|uniref:Type I restriction enzyme, S subunit n=1 Tax=Nitrosomonas oligotropha TaxID=42354 RepID=A0A1H8TZ19_9PROT|nr:restriction endonuclease subunit S [Nitrosomonas oligotropha]SDX38309.1 type I restriction enzyme, S subunit [Nitrosomonas oligotropha]SEO95834.1 type I restriction enzyme, S subunit [Nitrosomonas oligotropha]